jgi:hypothetical protein
MTLPSDFPDFQGKVVGVQIKELATQTSSTTWWWLESPTLQIQVGRMFLVGRAFRPDASQPVWYDGVTICIPWENIAYYTAETIENYHTNTRRLAAAKEASLKRDANVKPESNVKPERRGLW